MSPMNLAATLKSEISRVSRKEQKSQTLALKKASAQYRSDIAALKRRVAALEHLISHLSKGRGGPAAPQADQSSTANIRFSAKGFASLRKKQGLSPADMGLLIGVSDQSVYKYEKGEVQPKAKTIATIAVLRGLGKKAVAEKLAALK